MGGSLTESDQGESLEQPRALVERKVNFIN